jgi:glutamate-ammonia-ligase adenylyltransferase
MNLNDISQALKGLLGKKIPIAIIDLLVQAIPESGLLGLDIQILGKIIPEIVNLSESKPFSLIIDLETSSANKNKSNQTITNQKARIIVITLDRPGLFSVLSGILSAIHFETTEGQIITTNPIFGESSDQSQGSLSSLPDYLQNQRLAIDSFTGYVQDDPTIFHGLLIEKLTQVFVQYDQGPTKAKQYVIEEVARALGNRSLNPGTILAPISINHSITSDQRSRFEIGSVDTPFFLYSLSSALSLHNVSIESVVIHTYGDQILDIIELTDKTGGPIKDQQSLNRITLSILLSKQFTYFIDQAPDPLRALERFDTLIQDLGEVKNPQDIQQFLASSDFQRELALILGTSDFLWEDFIRVQHESILPMIKQLGERQLLSLEPENLESQLLSVLQEGAKKAEQDGSSDPIDRIQRSIAARVQALNDFKNRQSFLIDLDHIMVKDLDFFFLSFRLTALAELIVRYAIELAKEELTPRHGLPRTAAGIEAEWAVFGLGKLGGRALGYASDIELLFVYSDAGHTDGPSRLANRDYFERLFKNAAGKITARREGIFKVDLRLRPHGEDGPVAVRLQSFLEYFQKGGQAHSAERLALVRLRWIGGSKDLGEQVSRIRDQLIYEQDSIIIAELRALRKRQLDEKATTKKSAQRPALVRLEKSTNSQAKQPKEKIQINAKFSPGTLVDLEYNVQILQVIHGRNHPQLRVPGIHQALEELSNLGTIDTEEAQTMMAAYQFFRILINGLRMLRGNAQDLFLPPEDGIEYGHLARRIGYRASSEQTEAEQLRIDFENHSAKVRQFVERHLGRDAIPFPAAGTVVDLILGDRVSDELLFRVMNQAGIKNHSRGYINLQSLAGQGQRKQVFGRLIVLAWEVLSNSCDPDMALNNWEQFVRRLEDPEQHFQQLLSQPRRIHLLLSLFSVSQFLADTLIQSPGFFAWITDPVIVGKPRSQIEMEEDLSHEAREAQNRTDWLNRLRRFRKREILRIGLRDLALGIKLQEIMGEISFLARACCEVALTEIWKRLGYGTFFDQSKIPGIMNPLDNPGSLAPPDHPGPSPDRLVICGFGKLGGWELNYSSDIDLVAMYQPAEEQRTEQEEQIYTKVVRTLIQDLTDFTQEGQAYRVDFRLRPYGASGPLVSTLQSIVDYYLKVADLWEFQALIKLKPVAGNLSLGEIFLDLVKEPFIQKWDGPTVRSSIEKMRTLALQEHTKGLDYKIDVKNSRGGIRDIEFRVQGLQMIHCKRNPNLLKGNTLKSLELLLDDQTITLEDFLESSKDYEFLRRVEHYLQLAEDRQLHVLPHEDAQRVKLALALSSIAKEIPGVDSALRPRSIQDIEGLNHHIATFYRKLDLVMARVRVRYEDFLNQ